MRLLVAFTAHGCEVGGRFYNRSKALVNYEHLLRYRSYVSDVVIVLRCKKSDTIDPSWFRIDGEGVSVAPIPDPETPFSAFLQLPAISLAVLRAIKSCDRYYLKFPEPAATIVCLFLLLLRKKYAVEVVASSKEGILFAKKGMPFVRLYAGLFDFLTKFLVKRAHCATYVSNYLRKRYPTKRRDHEWVFSSAELDDETIGSPRSVESFRTEPFKVFCVGRMSKEKGHIYLVRAFKKVLDITSKSVELHMVGDGPERNRLESEAKHLGIGSSVHFHGYIKRGSELFSLLDEAHLFIMPSLTEGMGRCLIEAMARGLPCIGSRVGGIPEYLDVDALFPSGNAEAIAAKIIPLLADSEKLAQMSRRNFEFSKAFRPDALQVVKEDFWRIVIKDCK
jgi:glycosyltransferase involved in cell wall biosynthesis